MTLSPYSIGILYNKTNQFGLAKDADLLVKTLICEAKELGITVLPKIIDPREAPSGAFDILIHLEIPYNAWIPWARLNCMVVNPEWWVSESYDPYLSHMNLVIFKTEAARQSFLSAGLLTPERAIVIPWCLGNIPAGNTQQSKKREFLYLIGGSKNKAASATELLKMWKPEYPKLNIYTTLGPDQDFGGVDNMPINTRLVHKDLSNAERINLQKTYLGHCCCSAAEGFGYSAAEAENYGAFMLLNDIDSYREYYGAEGLLPTKKTIFPRVRADKSVLDHSPDGVAALDLAIGKFMLYDSTTTTTPTLSTVPINRYAIFSAAVQTLLSKSTIGVKASRMVRPIYFCPPALESVDCPNISIITLVYNRRKFWDLALVNLMTTDYPRDKMEWVVVDDSDDVEQGIADKIARVVDKIPGLTVRYVPLPSKKTVGAKRNIGVEKAAADIILMMDDDDHVPETAFRRRVAWLLRGKEKNAGAAVCTTIALYDLNTGISAVNVPPYDLPLGQRCSEATLTFTRDFWKAKPFDKVQIGEGEGFLSGREKEVIEMMPQHIIVAFSHGKNASSRRIPESGTPPGCFWGFQKEYLEFIHGLVGVGVEAAFE